MRRIFFLIIALFFVSGCSTYYPVRLNSYLNQQYGAKAFKQDSSFFVMDDKLASNQILESHIKGKIERLLSSNGYRVVPEDKADYILRFNYAESPGRVVVEERPEYHPQTTQPIYTYTSTGKTRVSYITYPGYTTYVPSRKTVFTTSLMLEVLDKNGVAPDYSKDQVWIGQAHTSGAQGDIRATVDYLLGGVFGYFGRDSGKRITVNIDDNNPYVSVIRH